MPYCNMLYPDPYRFFPQKQYPRPSILYQRYRQPAQVVLVTHTQELPWSAVTTGSQGCVV